MVLGSLGSVVAVMLFAVEWGGSNGVILYSVMVLMLLLWTVLSQVTQHCGLSCLEETTAELMVSCFPLFYSWNQRHWLTVMFSLSLQ